jgi:hypothetical protein
MNLKSGLADIQLAKIACLEVGAPLGCKIRIKVAIIKRSIRGLHYAQTIRLIQSLVLYELSPCDKETPAVSHGTQAYTGICDVLLKQGVPDGHIALSVDLEDSFFVRLILDEVGILNDRLILVGESHHPHVCLHHVVGELSVLD